MFLCCCFILCSIAHPCRGVPTRPPASPLLCCLSACRGIAGKTVCISALGVVGPDGGPFPFAEGAPLGVCQSFFIFLLCFPFKLPQLQSDPSHKEALNQLARLSELEVSMQEARTAYQRRDYTAAISILERVIEVSVGTRGVLLCGDHTVSESGEERRSVSQGCCQPEPVTALCLSFPGL